MYIVEPSIKVVTEGWGELVPSLARYARTCYKSEDKATPKADEALVKALIKNGHESVLEHEKITMLWVCDRGVSHELVRHRIASYSQESTRYVTYNNIAYINPLLTPGTNAYKTWEKTLWIIEKNYKELLDAGCSPQIARSILPNSLKTEVVVTMNIRELRAMLKLRTSAGAHPQFRQLALALLIHLQENVPVLFDDLAYDLKYPMDMENKLAQVEDVTNL